MCIRDRFWADKKSLAGFKLKMPIRPYGKKPFALQNIMKEVMIMNSRSTGEERRAFFLSVLVKLSLIHI